MWDEVLHCIYRRGIEGLGSTRCAARGYYAIESEHRIAGTFRKVLYLSAYVVFVTVHIMNAYRHWDWPAGSGKLENLVLQHQQEGCGSQIFNDVLMIITTQSIHAWHGHLAAIAE